MKQILFVIAMKKEATDIAEKLKLEKINENVYRKENISLIITGIGKQQTAINLTRYLENCDIKPDLIINMGYVGSTNSKMGEWVNVSKSYNYEWNIPGEQQYTVEEFNDDRIKTLENIKKLPCYSAESFVTHTDIKDDVLFSARRAALVDHINRSANQRRGQLPRIGNGRRTADKLRI